MFTNFQLLGARLGVFIRGKRGYVSALHQNRRRLFEKRSLLAGRRRRHRSGYSSQEGMVPSGGIGFRLMLTHSFAIKVGLDAWTTPPAQQPVTVDYAGVSASHGCSKNFAAIFERLLLCGCQLDYFAHSAYNQSKILRARKPIEDVLERSQYFRRNQTQTQARSRGQKIRRRKAGPEAEQELFDLCRPRPRLCFLCSAGRAVQRTHALRMGLSDRRKNAL